MKDVFEIHDSSINIQEILEEIELTIKKKHVSKEELEYLSKLDFDPESPASFREFDPLETSYLFEKGISPPKFTNPKLKFLKGPLKWFVIQFVELYSLIDKKLSEKRIFAFYNVIYELISLRSKIKKLEENYNIMNKKFIEFQITSGNNQIINFPWSSNFFNQGNNFQDIDHYLASKLDGQSKILVLEFGWGEFLKLLQTKNINFQAISFNSIQYNFIKNNVFPDILYLNSIDEIHENYSPTFSLLISENLSALPGYLIEKLFYTIREKFQNPLKIFCKYSNFSEEKNSYPFLTSQTTTIQSNLLPNFLIQMGFSNIHLDEFQKGKILLSFENNFKK